MRNKVLHLGISGFPFGTAAMQRVKITFKSLKNEGYIPIVISKKSNFKKDISRRVEFIEGIPVVRTSCLLNRPDSFLKRNLNQLTGICRELLILFRLRDEVCAALIYTPNFIEIVYYKILSKIFHFKACLVYVEFRSSIPTRQKGLTKFNDKLFDKFCHKFCDSAIVISEYLKNNLSKRRPALPILKIPAVTDFNYFKNIKPFYSEQGYMMYCGTVTYIEVISFIIDLFERTKSSGIYDGQLILVVSKNKQSERQQLNDRINKSPYSGSILLKSNIDYAELVSYYRGADILLIPLRSTIQDVARFPHKISEYTAASKPILSTNVGEMRYYFKDKISAILADEYSVESYYRAVSECLLTKKELHKLGENAYETGLKNFHYLAYSKLLKEFISSLQ